MSFLKEKRGVHSRAEFLDSIGKTINNVGNIIGVQQVKNGMESLTRKSNTAGRMQSSSGGAAANNTGAKIEKQESIARGILNNNGINPTPENIAALFDKATQLAMNNGTKEPGYPELSMAAKMMAQGPGGATGQKSAGQASSGTGGTSGLGSVAGTASKAISGAINSLKKENTPAPNTSGTDWGFKYNGAEKVRLQKEDNNLFAYHDSINEFKK